MTALGSLLFTAMVVQAMFEIAIEVSLDDLSGGTPQVVSRYISAGVATAVFMWHIRGWRLAWAGILVLPFIVTFLFWFTLAFVGTVFNKAL